MSKSEAASKVNRSHRGTESESVAPGSADTSVTIAMVADAARVSRATVSRVMNGKATVAPDLVRRVKQTASRLGYEPSVLARSLALGRTGMVAIVVPDLANPMFQGVIHVLSRAAADQGHRLLVAETSENAAEEPLLAAEARRRTDGLVLCAPRMPADELRRLAPRLSPFVLVNREIPGIAAPSLLVDYGTGVSDIVGYLRRLGHHRLAYLAGPTTSASNRLRIESLRQRATSGAIELIEVECGAMFADGHAAVDRVLGMRVTAVVAFNDLVAFGALSRLHELGVGVPSELSLVGFDDVTFARYTTPPLTTASVPQDELGQAAWRRLWALLSHEAPGPDVRYTPRLEVRGSTGPAPAGL